jgi:hypothetical protein
MKKITIIIGATALVSIIGCSPDRQLERIRTLERKGQYYKAWEKYQEFVAAHPKHPGAPEAVFRAGYVAQQHFNDCFMASTFYDEVIARYPTSEPWSQAATLQKNNCPDYFPLIEGSSWTEVDSDTKGKTARIEIMCETFSDSPRLLRSQAGRLIKTYFAGDKKSLVRSLVYKKEQTELQQSSTGQEADPEIIMKWPIDVGTRWATRIAGRVTNCEISSIDRAISVVAGDFEGCLLIRSYSSDEGAVKNDYYAPGVGHILTSITSKAGEKRITELASYRINENSSFSTDGTTP